MLSAIYIQYRQLQAQSQKSFFQVERGRIGLFKGKCDFRREAVLKTGGLLKGNNL